MSKLNCFERNQEWVLTQFQEGEFDYLDSASEVIETEFFRFIGAEKILGELASSYPYPRQKEEVPVWMYLASNITMRLHGAHSFHSYPYVVHCGGMLSAFGPEVAHKVTHPKTGDTTLSCKGFNQKNSYDRETPCDQDYLRKIARDTEAGKLQNWMNEDVAKTLSEHGAYDEEGIFIGDASYLFVPDNPSYEGSAKMLFDESDHPVSKERYDKMSKEQAVNCQWRRCYKMVSLLHTDWEGSFFLRVAIRILPGNQHENGALYELVDQFQGAVGKGVVKRLILDRGFIDGEEIGKCKQERGVDVLIPVKKSMTLYEDVLGMIKLPEVEFREVRPQNPKPIEPQRLPEAPEHIQRREAKRQETLHKRKKEKPAPDLRHVLMRSEVAGIKNVRTFERCPVPLNVIVNRETYGNGEEKIWMLLDTRALEDDKAAGKRREEYHLRISIEEGHRQLKCFWDLTKFTARAFSLVVNQVIFVSLAYNLLQLYLKKESREELNRRSRSRTQRQLLPNDSVVVIYFQNQFAFVTLNQYTVILLTLADGPKAKILKKTRRIEHELTNELTHPRRL